MSFDAKLKTLALELPEVPAPIGSYASILECDGWVFLSGLLPRKGHEIAYKGKAGSDVSLAQACEAAKLCALNALSVIRNHFGTLDVVERIIRVVGFVQSHPSFYDQPRVLNASSDLFKDVFGDRGVHVRSAVGVESLPGNATCEIEVTLRIR